jgi:N6-adenosine-specific RNA methylase IME4
MANPARYRTIVADPPWEYGEFVGFSGPRAGADAEGNRPTPTLRRSRPLPYQSMSVDTIAALPIEDMAAKDAWLWLWTTNRYIPDAFAIIPAWGFTYAATVVWKKGNGVSPFSQSPVSAVTDAEFLLVARRGSAKRIGRLDKLVIEAPRGGAHSRKPELFLDLIETVTPAPRIELFARRQRLGWDTWGNEALNHIDLGASA